LTLFIDTSVWSLAFRRDAPPDVPEVAMLRAALASGDDIASTGFVLLELLRGAVPTKAKKAIAAAFGWITMIEPTLDDYVGAADLGNTCRSSGVQLGTVDTLIAWLVVDRHFTLLSTDRDFQHAAPVVGMRVWRPE
jgi:predicted nucleic acid-binding protein